MAGNQLPVLTLDIDEEKIRQLHEISEKFKAAFGVGPGGFPAQAPPKPIPGSNHPKTNPGGEEETGFNKFLKNLNKEAQGTVRTFGLINKTLSATTSTLKGLFTSTLSWGAKVAALSVAGPFGYNLVARSASDTYRTSQGMNISTGQMQAANNVYGSRISGTSNIMQTLAAAQNDPQNPVFAGLINLGINPQDGAAENMPKLLERVSELLQQYKKTGVSQTVLNGMGLGGLIDSTNANQVLGIGDRLPMLNQNFREQSKQLDTSMGSGTQESYQAIYSNFSYNADQIGNTFLKTLSRLNGPITELSDSLTASIKKFLSGKNGAALFDTLASGIEKVARWIGGEDFQNDLKTFADCVRNIVQVLGQAITWIAGNVPGVDLNGTGTGRDGADPALVKFGDKYLEGKLPGANPLTNKYTGIFTEEDARNKYQMPDTLKNNIQAFVSQANDSAGLPAGLMSAIAEKESSWNPLAINKGSGAAGLFQFMPATAKGYGLEGDDVFDPNKATIAAAKYLSDNMKRYDGDIAKSLTQYNGGRIDEDGNLSVKKETVDYLIKILPKVEGGIQQHPGIMWQLSEAKGNLAKANSDARATIKLDINQMPGSDISAQVKGIYVTPR